MFEELFQGSCEDMYPKGHFEKVLYACRSVCRVNRGLLAMHPFVQPYVR